MTALEFNIAFADNIADAEEGRCFFCGTDRQIERHHIFPGFNRQKSDRMGLIVPLCHAHHNEPPNGVHFSNATALIIKRYGQIRAMQENGWDIPKFIEEFGSNYLF